MNRWRWCFQTTAIQTAVWPAAALTVALMTGCAGPNHATSSSSAPDAGIPAATGTGGGPSVSVSSLSVAIQPPVQPTLDGATVNKYVDALPTFPTRIDGTKPVTVEMVEFQQKILPAEIYASLPAPYSAGTTLWGYKINGGAPSYPSVTIEARQGTQTDVTYTNSLEAANGAPTVLAKSLIIDLSIHSADTAHLSRDNRCRRDPPLPTACLGQYAAPVPTVVHLHGAEVLSDFDGQPDTWFTPGLLLKGPAFVGNVYHYPNQQEATTLWFHDHALGLTRQHVYAGLAGFYLIRDGFDTGAATNPIRLPAGAYETELLIADKQFDRNGQLYFPAGLAGSGVGLNGSPPNPDHHPYWIPEFFGDVITVNGKSWPVFHVEPRRYRFRMVNASNARMYRMALADLSTPDSPIAGPPIWQIGSDGGFLDRPAQLSTTGVPPLFLAPAERADVIIDFAGSRAGAAFTLTNDAQAPFPSGDDPDPNTSGQIMQFVVDQALQGTDATFDPSAAGAIVRAGGTTGPQPIVNIRPNAAPDQRRQLVLVEVEAVGGPEEVLLNNSEWDGNREGALTPTAIAGSVSNGHGINSTENPQVGSTEIWEIANLTEDAHPIHIHLIQFQLINRQDMVLAEPDGDTTYRGDWDAQFPGGTFLPFVYSPGTFIPGYGPPNDYSTPNAAGALGGNLAFADKYLVGTPTLPDANESGWKDTIKMLPKTVTRLALRFAPQDLPLAGPTAPVRGTNSFAFDPTAAGPGYTWHCHILDHEDNEMMRPYLLSK